MIKKPKLDLVINRQFYKIDQNCIILKCAKKSGENN